jgi:Uma2 family endonuclease
MSVATAKMTVEEFLQQPEEILEWHELVDGEMVEMPKSNVKSARVQENILEILIEHNLRNRVARIGGEAGWILSDGTLRKPDAYVELIRSPGTPAPAGPDLPIEVVSVEKASDLMKKVHQYLESGAKAVWIFFPEQRVVWVFHPGMKLVELREGDVLEEPDVLPGFRAPVSRFFAEA